MSRDPRIDAYIAKSQEFARPILEHVRAIVHEACPEVEEKIKWGFPHFDYKGMLCSVAAFKEHCAFGFWKGSLILDKDGVSGDAMGQFGRITSIKDLPSKAQLKKYIKLGMKLNDEGVTAPARTRPKRDPTDIVVPDDLAAALKKSKKAAAAFEKFSPSHKREYIEWVNDAKREETRIKRIETAVEWISEGKSRNWKYERKA